MADLDRLLRVGRHDPEWPEGSLYVTRYAKNVMAEDDNLPVGILLCTQKDHALVEYALAGMNNQLFVSKYQLHLPDREQLRRELERTLKEES